jgi:phenylacetate-CoA ligase
MRFPGGVLGRADEMVQVRGVNVYPAAVESIVREESAIYEFQIEILERRRMWEIRAEIEVNEGSEPEKVKARLEKALHRKLGLRADVAVVPVGRLPRFELKARRFRIQRETSQNET